MIGIDIIKIDRIKKAAKNASFLKVFTKAELDYINSKKDIYQTMAGIFAAKEAVVKAVGTGFNGIKPIDIQVCFDEYGKPFVNLSGNSLSVSITHDGGFAVAVAVLVMKDINLS